MSRVMTLAVYADSVVGVKVAPTEWIKVEEVRPGAYKIIANSMTEADDGYARYALCFTDWDDEVENCDDFYELSGFHMSDHLKWNDVEMSIYEECHASSVERLQEALDHVSFYAYCPEDL
ncbi:MAG TPA: hypothetical protein VFT59_03985 [Candidatus Saccharimonadales bacterium]|nr:hypothetical protein [Candidatus Saccharimonadales bacterium]